MGTRRAVVWLQLDSKDRAGGNKDLGFDVQSGRARIAVRCRPAAFLTNYAALGSMRTGLARGALGSSMFKTPSFKIALTFKLFTSTGR